MVVVVVVFFALASELGVWFIAWLYTKASRCSYKSCYLGSLHPPPPSSGRKEFADYLPEGTQGIVVQPVGKLGVMVAGTDTIRGISMLDQVDKCGYTDEV